jgi:pyruvate kinase
MTNPFKKKKTTIIVTLGPSTFEDHLLKKVEDRGVDFVRINLSHTSVDKVEETVQYITDTISTPLMIDTEGSQVRTGYLGVDSITLTMGDHLRLYKKHIVCDKNNIYIRPQMVVDQLQVGSLLFIDFDAIILRVDSLKELKENGYIICSVLSGGVMGNNKAVTVQQQSITLSALSEKDVKSLEIAKKYNTNLFSMSFVDSADDVLELKKLHPNAKVVAKIETEKGVNNLGEILDVTDGILIDRGDLSREIPLERIAFAQKIIINKAIEGFR